MEIPSVQPRAVAHRRLIVVRQCALSGSARRAMGAAGPSSTGATVWLHRGARRPSSRQQLPKSPVAATDFAVRVGPCPGRSARFPRRPTLFHVQRLAPSRFGPRARRPSTSCRRSSRQEGRWHAHSRRSPSLRPVRAGRSAGAGRKWLCRGPGRGERWRATQGRPLLGVGPASWPSRERAQMRLPSEGCGGSGTRRRRCRSVPPYPHVPDFSGPVASSAWSRHRGIRSVHRRRRQGHIPRKMGTSGQTCSSLNLICDAVGCWSLEGCSGSRMAVRTDRSAALFPSGDMSSLRLDDLQGVDGGAPAGCSPSRAWLLKWVAVNVTPSLLGQRSPPTGSPSKAPAHARGAGGTSSVVRHAAVPARGIPTRTRDARQLDGRCCSGSRTWTTCPSAQEWTGPSLIGGCELGSWCGCPQQRPRWPKL